MDIHELRSKYESTLNEMEELVGVTESESRDFNEDEQGEYEALEAQADKLAARIRRKEKLEESRSMLPKQPASVNAPVDIQVNEYSEKDFRSLSEFVQAVVLNPQDKRLRGLYVEQRETPSYSGLEMGTPGKGGYLVPDEYMTQIMEFSAQNAVIRPRATVLPPGASPDAKVHIPLLDQASTRGVYSGVSVSWIDEGEEKPETTPQFGEITLEPHEVAAHTPVTDKLLRNSGELDMIIRRLLTGAVTAAEDVAFISGDGDGKPTGFIGHASNVEVNRETAGSASYTDLVEMMSRMYFGGNPAWLVTQRAMPELMHIEDGAGNLIWQPSMRDGVPGTIFGYPVVVSNRMPALGAKGDISFVDLSYYLIKDGAPLAIAASEHVQFLNNRTVIKAFKTVDARPWPTAPLQDENDEYVSPFVVLDVPEAS